MTATSFHALRTHSVTCNASNHICVRTLVAIGWQRQSIFGSSIYLRFDRSSLD